MRKSINPFLTFAILTLIFIFSSSAVRSQTTGTMTFTFTQAVPSSTASKNVFAVWIEDANGNFVKTRMRFWSNSTNDHLPSWVMKCGQNTTDAITGATLRSTTNPTAFGVKTVNWDGKDVNGNVVADGTYKVLVESSWCNPEPANNQHKFLASFTFTKGSTTSTVSPTDANLSNITITWTPSGTSSENVNLFSDNDLSIFPNPSSGKIQMNFKKSVDIEKIKVVSASGKLIFFEDIQQNISGVKTIDLSDFAEGVYLIEVVLPTGKSVAKSIFIKK